MGGHPEYAIMRISEAKGRNKTLKELRTQINEKFKD
jgi:hypothetical protein